MKRSKEPPKIAALTVSERVATRKIDPTSQQGRLWWMLTLAKNPSTPPRCARKSSFSATCYADNIPRKLQALVAMRFAPFLSFRSRFLNTLRLEAAFLHAEFPDASSGITGPIGYLYWQWR